MLKKQKRVWVIYAGDYFGLWIFNYWKTYGWWQTKESYIRILTPFGGVRTCLVARLGFVQIEIGKRRIQ